MNTGLQDAHNLANLLADVAQGHLDAAALDRYERERRPVALRLVRVTDRAFSVVARRGRRTAWLRRRFSGVVANLAPRVLHTPLGARIGGYLGQYRIRYHFSPDNVAAPVWAQDRVVGLRLPPVGDNPQALQSFTWQLHTYGAQAERPDVPDWTDGPHNFGPDTRDRLRPGCTSSAPTATLPRPSPSATVSSTKRPCRRPCTHTRLSTRRYEHGLRPRS